MGTHKAKTVSVMRPAWWLLVAAAGVVVIAVAGVGGYGLANLQRQAAAVKAHPAVAPSPRPKPSLSPAPSPSLSPIPEPVALAPSPSPSERQCRIAVAAYSPGSGGFVSLPNGAYTVDPKSSIKVSPNNNQGYQPYFGWSYSFARAKWIPVPYGWVSPDAVTYAYTEYDDASHDLYIGKVADGSVTERALDRHYQVLDWEPEGIYASYVDDSPPFGGAPHGIARLDPVTGAGVRLTPRGNWQVWSRTQAFGIEFNRDGPATLLLHMDLRSGRVESWFDGRGLSVSPVGIDGEGAAIVVARNEVTLELWRIAGPGAATRLSSTGGGNDVLQPLGAGITDGGTLWLQSNKGLLAYTPAGGFRIVSPATGYPASLCH